MNLFTFATIAALFVPSSSFDSTKRCSTLFGLVSDVEVYSEGGGKNVKITFTFNRGILKRISSVCQIVRNSRAYRVLKYDEI